jgi:cyclophilin family peptidyl-prolyl cis-trans isomerase
MIATIYASAPMRLRAPSLATIAIVALLAGCGGSSGSSSDTSSQSSSAGGLPAGCKGVAKPKPKHVKLQRPPQTVKRGEKLTATISTSCGSFEIALDTRDSPKTVNSFADLAKRGFYDGLDFHRIVPHFVIQGGDPLGNGQGGAGYTVVERPPANTAYRRGVVAMAKSQFQPPGASSSQFFVVTAPADAGLPPDYAVLGKVTAGMDAVMRIASLADPKLGAQGGEPRAPVVIDRVAIQ